MAISKYLSLAIGLLLLSVSGALAQPFAGPGQRGFPFVRFSKVAAKAGFVNTPTVLTSGGNATATLAVPVTGGLCATAGCTDTEIVANASNAGTLVMTTQPATVLAQGQFVFIDVQDSGTAPSDVYFVAGAGVTLKSLQPKLTAANLIGTTAADKLARQNSCGIAPATGDLIYNAIWISPNLYVTGCSTNPSATAISYALINGAQWQVRNVSGPGTDTVLATDSIVAVNTTSGSETENLPACVSSNIGQEYTFKKTDSTAGTITLTPNGADTIDGAASVVISAPQAFYGIICQSAALWMREWPFPWAHGFGGTDVTAVGSTEQLLTSNGSNFVVQSRPVRPGFDFAGTVGTNSILAYTCPEVLNFPNLLAGSYPDANATVTCGTNPGQTDTYTVKVAGVSKGTFTVSTSCAGVFTGVTPAFSCNAGQRLEIDGPGSFSVSAPADVAITLGGHRNP